jgi:ketosteroid isomerase-like protein
MKPQLTMITGCNSEFAAFVEQIDAAQDAFADGRPDNFKALWLHSDDVTLCGGHGGVIEHGWSRVGTRLDWASSTYRAGERTNEIIAGHVDGDFAYLVRKEVIEAQIGGPRHSRQELRVTMIFQRGGQGWRIVHRHGDSQTEALVAR